MWGHIITSWVMGVQKHVWPGASLGTQGVRGLVVYYFTVGVVRVGCRLGGARDSSRFLVGVHDFSGKVGVSAISAEHDVGSV